MDAALDTRLEIIPLSKHIGAEIRGVDLSQPLDVATSKAIHRAWLDHAVVLFRGLKLEQEDLLRVTEVFGEIGGLARPPKFYPKGYSQLLPNIMMISNIRENGETIGALPDGEMNFHHDMLDPEIRNKLEGRKAFHHYNYGSMVKGDTHGVEAFAESVHPVFRTHEE